MRWTSSVTDTKPIPIEPPTAPVHPMTRLGPGDAELIESTCVDLHIRLDQIGRRDAEPATVANRDESALLAFGRAARMSRAERFARWCADERVSLMLCVFAVALCLVVILGGW